MEVEFLSVRVPTTWHSVINVWARSTDDLAMNNGS
jgi:hypothetical protein